MTIVQKGETTPERIKRLRLEKGLVQERVAEVLNVSRQQIGKYENGKNEIPGEAVARYANFFGCSTDYILCRTDEPLTVEDYKKQLDECEMTPELAKLWNNLKNRADLQQLILLASKRTPESILKILPVIELIKD